MASKKKRSATAGTRGKRMDAITLLMADHRQVEAWFSQFSKSKSTQAKRQYVSRICDALTIHTTIEEEVFYPAYIGATGDKDTHHEALVEHAGAKALIAQIRSMSASDDFYTAKVTVLSEMIKHHVKEEEQPGGMFAKAKKSDMDLQALGEKMQERKQELQSAAEAA